MPAAVPPFEDPAVAACFDAFAPEARKGLMVLRGVIFEEAARLPQIERLQETLKWGQPAYLTPDVRAATTIRLGVPRSGGFALFTHCQSSVMADFRALFGDRFTFDGNRAIHFEDAADLPLAPIAALVRGALTYHLK